MRLRKFIVGAYWGGLLAVAFGLLPIIALRPRFLAAPPFDDLPQLTPVVLLAGFALLASVLAAGTMMILRELAAVRAAVEQGGSFAGRVQNRLSSWAATPSSRRPASDKATTSCPACARTNWNDAFACVDCGAPLACDAPGPVAAH